MLSRGFLIFCFSEMLSSVDAATQTAAAAAARDLHVGFVRHALINVQNGQDAAHAFAADHFHLDRVIAVSHDGCEALNDEMDMLDASIWFLQAFPKRQLDGFELRF